MAQKKNHKKTVSTREVRRRKISLCLKIIGVLFFILIIQLIRLQIFDSTDQYARQIDQSVEEVALQADRGNIYDRNMNILAQDSSAMEVTIVPEQVNDEDIDKVVQELSEKLNRDEENIREKVTRIEDDPVEVAENVSSSKAEEITTQISEGVSYDEATKTLYAVPAEIAQPGNVADIISRILISSDETLDYDTVLEIVTRRENSHILIRGEVDNVLAEEIKNDLVNYEKDDNGNVVTDSSGEKVIVDYNGIELIPDHRRYYTNGNFASYVLGFTGQDYYGLTGIEETCDDILSGTDGIMYYQKDSDGNQLASQTKIIKESVPGEDVVLTIDRNLQIATEKYLEEGVTEWEAKSGTAIVMDSETGEILAMSTYPDYNLNDPYTIDEDYASTHAEDFVGQSETEQLEAMWKNPAVSFIYEPGSTFKAITASAALEEGVVTPDTPVYCPGYIMINGVRVGCTAVHGDETVAEAISNSCNPGLVQIIQKLDPSLFYQYVYNFGYGAKTGIELTGEEAGIINRVVDDNGDYNLLDYSTFSFGQGLATTPIQNLTGLNAVVNNGEYEKPTIILDPITDVNNTAEGSKKQIISEETSSEMREIMEDVITNDTSLSAMTEGYSMGGKTGTAEKFIDGEYSSTKYVTSFFNFAPVEDPKYSILVVLDEPRSNAFGSTSAAPIAINIMKQALALSSDQSTEATASTDGTVTVPDLVGQTVDFACQILDEKGIKYSIENDVSTGIILSQSIPVQTEYTGETLILTAGEQNETTTVVTVPDLTGMAIQSANELLGGLDLKMKVSGSGFVASQDPIAGTLVERDTEVQVTGTE